ncbi:hypothetical protein HK100_006080 [Physocladia obscura]|uniref:CCZ1/INTU/HSP4 first Longin domain-containing protein n=1 Tax=Physocladia obscura TaxID=109957 RepID=A0AAD5XBW8_9FUNG|nr:hypothetical protein HK100_006080 [Physocladia obscura]
MAGISMFGVFSSNTRKSNDESAPEVLFAFPPTTPLLQLERLCGLAQGISSLAIAFSQNKPVSIIKSTRHRIAILSPEPGFWIVMKVKFETQTLQDRRNFFDAALEAIVLQMYQRFRLLHNTFTENIRPDSNILENSVRNFENLKLKLDAVFSTYLSVFDPSSLDISTVHSNISLTLPLVSALSYLRVTQTLISVKVLFATAFPFSVQLEPHLFYKNAHVAVSPIKPHLSPLFAYIIDPTTGIYSGSDGGIVGFAKPKGIGIVRENRNLRQNLPLSKPSTPIMSKNEGEQFFTGYVVGPEPDDHSDNTFDSGDGWAGAKIIHLNSSKSIENLEQHRILVFQILENTTLIILIRPDTDDRSKPIPLRRDAFSSLIPKLTATLYDVATQILPDAYSKQTKDRQTCPVKYYKSDGESAISTNFNITSGTSSPSSSFNEDILKQIEALHTDFKREGGVEMNQIFLKSYANGWLMAQHAKNTEEEMYAVFTPGSSGAESGSAVVSGTAVQVGTAANKGLHAITEEFSLLQNGFL